MMSRRHYSTRSSGRTPSIENTGNPSPLLPLQQNSSCILELLAQDREMLMMDDDEGGKRYDVSEEDEAIEAEKENIEEVEAEKATKKQKAGLDKGAYCFRLCNFCYFTTDIRQRKGSESSIHTLGIFSEGGCKIEVTAGCSSRMRRA